MGTSAIPSLSLSAHKKNSPFFKRPPHDWSISEYLSFRHPHNRTPRRILDGWKKSLHDILHCTSDACCTDAQRLRARDLLSRYKEQGNGSDRQYGQAWLARNTPRIDAPPVTPPAQTTYFGPVYNAPVESTRFTQTLNTAPMTNNTLMSRVVSEVDSDVGGDQVSETRTLDDDPGIDAEDESEPEDSPTETVSEPLEDTSSAKVAFATSYAAMNDDSKWVLSTGRTVEGVIFEACREMDEESFANSHAQSFVIDVTDPTMQSWFMPDEWKEICARVPAMPKPDIVFIESLRRFFNVKTTAELRDVLRKTSYLPDGVEYDPAIHFDSEWADLVIRLVLVLFEAPGEPLRAAHLEDWYTSYLWSPILDQCLLSLPGMTIERKESPCRATTTRKNRHRTQTGKSHRIKSGRRLDAVIRTVEDDYHEYGGMEVARTFTGTTSSKWLGDAWKLVRALRDMLFRLHELVEHDDRVVGGLQVVGVFCAGLKMQVVRMASRGYVSLLQRERMQAVPTGVGDMSVLLRLLVEVARMKSVVRECREMVGRRHEGRSEEDLVRELMDGPREGGGRLGWGADTP